LNLKSTKKICLITPGSIASNPRLVKEAQALIQAGYKVHLIFTQYLDFIADFDADILKNNPQWAYDILDRTGKNKKLRLPNMVAIACHKICRMLLLSGKKSDFILTRAINRYFSWQLQKAVKTKADLYIAHNLAALPVAVSAAKKNKAKCGFDMEDFHRNETADDPNNPDVKLKIFLEEKYIPQTNYITSSSLPITGLYQKIFPFRKIVTVLNVFPIIKEVQSPIAKTDKTLKLFWFSQTIGLNRGLQDALSALKILENEPIELHLLGFLGDKTSIGFDKIITYLKFKKKPNIFFYKQINPDQLPIFAAQFDVGLALEPGFCINNNAALSNKIFTYLQSGLAIAASDTTAQKQFLNQNPTLGFCYEKGNGQQLATILKRFFTKPDLLQETKLAAFQAARNNLNWETESVKFLKVVAETLAD
jgi:glycosyltransferase involved in cell wall biosynthesis